ncbi:hypothetical protein PENTCL1PPCAC_8222, partial [Pristionchus entomophagus]
HLVLCPIVGCPQYRHFLIFSCALLDRLFSGILQFLLSLIDQIPQFLLLLLTFLSLFGQFFLSERGLKPISDSEQCETRLRRTVRMFISKMIVPGANIQCEILTFGALQYSMIRLNICTILNGRIFFLDRTSLEDSLIILLRLFLSQFSISSPQVRHLHQNHPS